MAESGNLLGRLAKLRDEKMDEIATELLSNPRFAQALGAAIARVTKTKERMNRNVALMMSMTGLPSKNDYETLAQRAQSMSKNINRLEERIDELTARLEKLGDKLGTTKARTKTAAR